MISIKKYISDKLSERVKRIIRKFVPYTKTIRKNTEIPQEELRIFNILKDELEIVFDVGARDDLSFYKIKSDISYHLFEPNKEFIASLKKQKALLKNPDITINEFGLSDKKEDDCIYYENSQSFIINPFLNKDIDCGQRYSLRRLDDYVIEKNISKIDFLKIDAEGLDYKIILGGINTVKNKVSYIQFEYWDGVQKFVDLLGDTFNLYLMMEPILLKSIEEQFARRMSIEQKQKNYRKSIIPLDKPVIELIDEILSPRGYGGNIIGISKKLKNVNIEKLTFEV